jgi:hypothetical protein
LAVLSYYIYSNSPPGSGAFEYRFKNLFEALSETDPFDIEVFADADVEVAILSNSRLALVGFRGTDDGKGEWVSQLGNSPPVSVPPPPAGVRASEFIPGSTML